MMASSNLTNHLGTLLPDIILFNEMNVSNCTYLVNFVSNTHVLYIKEEYVMINGH